MTLGGYFVIEFHAYMVQIWLTGHGCLYLSLICGYNDTLL